MAEYPQYEIKVIYKCQLCKEDHVSIARAKGGGLAAELAGGAPRGQLLTKRCMEIAKKGVIKDFFKAHPKAGLGDFKFDILKAEETVAHGENAEEINKDTLGVPMTEEEVKEIVDELGREDEIKGGTASSIEEVEGAGPIETGREKGMDFEGVQKMVEEKLDRLVEAEKELTVKLAIVNAEIKQFRELVEAAKRVRIDKKTEESKNE
jgi:hypothetical protein